VTAAAWAVLAAYAVPVLILLGCCACAASFLDGHQRLACLRRATAARITRTALRALIAVLSVRTVRTAVVRARWAWRCRGCPPPGSEVDPLDRDDMRAFVAAVRAWRLPAAPERTRT
jgi:hypothetical protein